MARTSLENHYDKRLLKGLRMMTDKESRVECIKLWAVGFNTLNADHYNCLQQAYEKACRSDYLGYPSARYQRELLEIRVKSESHSSYRVYKAEAAHMGTCNTAKTNAVTDLKRYKKE